LINLPCQDVLALIVHGSTLVVTIIWGIKGVSYKMDSVPEYLGATVSQQNEEVGGYE